MKNYRMKNWSIKNIERKGFVYSREFSNSDETYYVYSFPVYRWENFIVLRCEIRICIQTKEIWIDVYDSGIVRTRYAPFYYIEYGDYDPILEVINNKINEQLEKLEITEAKRKNYERRNESNQDKVHKEFKGRNNRTSNQNRQRRLDRSQSSRRRRFEER